MSRCHLRHKFRADRKSRAIVRTSGRKRERGERGRNHPKPLPEFPSQDPRLEGRSRFPATHKAFIRLPRTGARQQLQSIGLHIIIPNLKRVIFIISKKAGTEGVERLWGKKSSKRRVELGINSSFEPSSCISCLQTRGGGRSLQARVPLVCLSVFTASLMSTSVSE